MTTPRARKNLELGICKPSEEKEKEKKNKRLPAPKNITFNAHLFWLHNVNKKPFYKRAWEI